MLPARNRASWSGVVSARRRVGVLAATASAVAALLATAPLANADRPHDRELLTPDSSGLLATVSSRGGVLDEHNPFFESLGTNGRTCATCHVPSAAWTLTPAEVQQRFRSTRGLDPLFRTVDGSNSPNADVSSVQARTSAFSMLLDKGVLRVGIGIPANAEFSLVKADDPYGFASASQLSLFRRPLPSTNLEFISGVMWDGRESVQKLLPTNTPAQNESALRFDLAHQALDATLGHAQASTPPTQAQQNAIVDFEISLYTAQLYNARAGFLQSDGAHGGPRPLTTEPFAIGVNDLVVKSTQPPSVVPPEAPMTLFQSWASSHHPGERAVARGEEIFDSKPITISGVAGLNDTLGLPSFKGTCATCHNDPNVGNHSTSVALNLGVSDASRRTPDMPLYTLRNDATGATLQTTDPGLALITGKWADVGKFKGPTLRGLAARAPYFHNGSAANLGQVVDFYNTRFGIGLSAREHDDLVAFLSSL